MKELVNKCARCRICEGAAYQAPPALYAGDINAPVLVIAQNPGEIKYNDLVRRANAKNMLLKADRAPQDEDMSEALLGWYFRDITTSPGYANMSRVFGPNWLDGSTYLYTNSVRCRTERNASPSAQMMKECWQYTRELIAGRKAVVMVGSVAKRQTFGETTIAKAKVVTLDDKLCLYIPHYVLWTPAKEEAYRFAVEQILDAI